MRLPTISRASWSRRTRFVLVIAVSVGVLLGGTLAAVAGITYHDGYYYLFVSVDNCCRGISSTYHVQVGRSRSITGPYLDAAGTGMMNGGGMEVQGTDAVMIGPGGEFVFTSGGPSYLVCHYYDAFDNGDAWVQVRPLTWVGGWPVTGRALVPVPGEQGPPGS
jgi:arabinan endo-1,5-alpha-L-arabinosidase